MVYKDGVPRWCTTMVYNDGVQR